MSHKSSHHVHIIMSGHNPEHHHHSKGHHRGTSNVRHHMKHAGDHNVSHETRNVKPCDILMRQHHFHGGISSAPPTFSRGGKAHKSHRYATGGHVDHESTGGMAHHHHHRRRRHHDIGGNVDFGNFLKNAKTYRNPMDNLGARLNQVKSQYYGKPLGMEPSIQTMYRKRGGSTKKHCYADGGETKEYGEKPLTGQLRRGGRARHHHAEGEHVEEKRHGGRARGRQHHYWGQNVIGRLPLVGGIANSIANTAGTLDPHKYGGAEYTARTKGQKAADIFSTIGNLGANIALSKGAAKKRRGGGVHHKYRHHHAAGGAGKIRKGMMTESGHMIHQDI